MSKKRGPDSGGSPLKKKIEFCETDPDEDLDWMNASPEDQPGMLNLSLPPSMPSSSPSSSCHLADSFPVFFPSPVQPTLLLSESDKSNENSQPGISSEFNISPLPPSQLGIFSQPGPNFTSSQTSHRILSQPKSSQSCLLSLPVEINDNSEDSFSSDSFEPSFLPDYQIQDDEITKPFKKLLETSLAASKYELGTKATSALILEDNDLKQEIKRLILSSAQEELKRSLKKSKLSADKKSREYLLSLTPTNLCKEFMDNAPEAYQILTEGLLGVADPEVVLDSHHLINNVALLYSTISKSVNRKASGYSLLLTSMARDGGLREDSIKLFSNLSHPRTVQKYDKEVLAKDWDCKLKEVLALESEKFQELKIAEINLESLLQDLDVDAIAASVEELKQNLPKQVQVVWDNLNLRTKPRFQRQRDTYEDYNLDWMASLLIQERISANHMEHVPGRALKDPESLSIQDFVPSEKEKDYLFSSLVHYYTFRLVSRHPLVFKAINSCIKVLVSN